MDRLPLRVAVLGSTGSIGRQTLDVFRQFPDRFRAVALAGGQNTAELAAQVAEFRPRYVASAAQAADLSAAVEQAGSTMATMDEMALADDVDILLVGTAGAAGLTPTLERP